LIQPMFTFLKSPLYDQFAVGKMNEREISARFEKGNMLDRTNPNFHIVSEQDALPTAKSGTFAFCSGRRTEQFLALLSDGNG
jgi:hypothetical protein